MSTPQELDWRTLPLSGTTLIEASAGTGKTWNIALLHLRLLIERGVHVRQILVTTLTDAAADELKSRIRLRLLDAERLATALAAGLSIADDERELADFIAARIESEGSASLLARLRLALADVDLAPISPSTVSAAACSPTFPSTPASPSPSAKSSTNRHWCASASKTGGATVSSASRSIRGTRRWCCRRGWKVSGALSAKMYDLAPARDYLQACLITQLYGADEFTLRIYLGNIF